jgi:hypothetical protein
VIVEVDREQRVFISEMEERRETLCVRVEKKRIDCEREREARTRLSPRSDGKEKENGEKDKKREK